MKGTIISETIISNKWGKYATYEVDYTRKDGSKERHIREVQDSGNGATILLYNVQSKKIILVRQYRLATQLNGNHNGLLIETVAGLVEEKEHHHQTVIREAQEETGITPENVKYLYSAYATPGAKTEIIHFYIGSYMGEPSNRFKGIASENEEIEVLELPFEKAYEMIYSGDIIDAKTIILLQYARMHIFAPTTNH